MLERGLISAKELSKKELLAIFEKTKEIKAGKIPSVKGNVALLFFEPSTRTFNSFKEAAQKIGCHVMGFAFPKGTSLEKGESLIDTARMFIGYGAQCIVIRHPKAGAPLYLREFTGLPVINAGDNCHEHPTQAVLDCYTIWEAFGRISGLKIGIMGDLKYGRTPSSLSYALSNWKVKLYFIAPDQLQINRRFDNVIEEIEKKGIEYELVNDYREVISELDVLYVTRIQKERFPDPLEYEKVRGSYRVDPKGLEGCKERLKIMHPLPRVDELSPELDSTKHALYFEQAKNGLYTRMAILSFVFGDKG